MRYLLFTAEKKFRPGSSSYGWGFLLGGVLLGRGDCVIYCAFNPVQAAANFDRCGDAFLIDVAIE